jgi:nicotinamidase-related amidase
MTQALLLIDIQNDYFPGGAMELVGSTEATANAAQLLHAFRRKNLPIIHIQHISARPGAIFFLPNTDGVRIRTSVAPLEDETVFQKHFPNAFRETPLFDHLRQNGITRLVIAGMMTHMCVDTTVRAACDLGFQCIVAHDACATRSLMFSGKAVAAELVQTAFMASLNGTFATLQSTGEICTALSK